jgi:nucleoside-diphosphate-sugar epimerase
MRRAVTSPMPLDAPVMRAIMAPDPMRAPMRPGGRRDRAAFPTGGPFRRRAHGRNMMVMLPTRTDGVLITGATGFVGTAILLRILERSDRPVVALVRATDRPEAAARVREALADLVPHAAVLDAYMSRVDAVPADLLADGLGLRFGDREDLAFRCDEILHCAASVSFTLPLDAARAVNAAGAARVAELATCCAVRGAGLQRIVHVSTAYVAGERSGTFGEDDVTAPRAFRNTYEQTKHEAERLLRAWTPRLPLQVVRPSIVVGDRDTGWTRSFNVLYWPLKAFARGRLPVVPAVADAPVDVVPVDYVADALVFLLENSSASGVLNLVAGREACTVDDLIGLTASAYGRERPPVVAPGSTGTGSSHADDQGAVYFPYFDMDMVFDDSRARALLGPAGIRCPHLSDYFPHLIEYARSARWGKSPQTREDAQAAAAAAA